MHGAQQLGLFLMAVAILCIGLFIADTWQKGGIRQGYMMGYSDASAGRCLPIYIAKCGDPKPTETK